AGDCASSGVTVTDVDLVAGPAEPWSRTKAQFPFAPSIAGVAPGSFTGTLRVENRQTNGAPIDAGSSSIAVNLRKPAILSVSPQAASLGQYVDVTGGGFAGAAADEVTLIHLTGAFTPAGAPASTPVDLKLVPRWISGTSLRYVLDEADALG